MQRGVFFKCTVCGRCCTGVDDGYVFVNGEEIEKIASYLGIGATEFIGKYTEVITSEYREYNDMFRPTGRKYFLPSIVLLQDKDTGRCVFLGEDNKCKIYPVRPRQCRTWPIWNTVFGHPDMLAESLAKCPGFTLEKGDDDAEFYDINRILEIIKEEIIEEQKYINLMKENGNDLSRVYPFFPKHKGSGS